MGNKAWEAVVNDFFSDDDSKELDACRVLKLENIYRHFKGGLYMPILIALDSETGGKSVVYMRLKTREIYVRDYEMFMSRVDKDKYPTVSQMYRFQEIDQFEV